MTVYDGFQCERLAAAILQEQGYVCEVCELRTHRYTAEGGEQYQNRVDFFREFDVVAIPTKQSQETYTDGDRAKLIQVTRNRSRTAREEKKEGIADWATRHEPVSDPEFWYWTPECEFAVHRWMEGWLNPVTVEPGLDADRLLARHDESIDQEIQ